MSDQSNLTLTDAYVYTPKKDKNAIFYSAGSTGTLTINGIEVLEMAIKMIRD